MRILLTIGVSLFSMIAIAQADLTFEEYNPSSTLVVPVNPVVRAKYPFIDIHSHQYRMSTQNLSELIKDMDKLNMGIMINLILMLLNLLPVPPLDGGRIVTGLLKPAAAYRFAQIERYGLFILLLLLFTGVLGKILMPLLVMVKKLLFTIVGL